MNERIKELAKQAGYRDIFDNDTKARARLEKYTELIVRECAWIANDPAPSVYDHDSYKLGRKFAGIDVLKHFGVEE